jgi:alpha-tubulin suppressor-like RCC1 family protein
MPQSPGQYAAVMAVPQNESAGSLRWRCYAVKGRRVYLNKYKVLRFGASPGRRRLLAIGPVLLGLVALAVASSQAAVPSEAGRIYAFGDNQYGELGSTTNDITGSPNPTPTLVSLPAATGPVTQVADGELHSLALTSTGQLYAFGSNKEGELGNATHNGTEEPNPTPTLVGLPAATGPVTQVAAGNLDSLAVTSTGQLYAFGLNEMGELGLATNSGTTTPNPTPTLVSLPGATGPVSQIAAGTLHTLALTSTGQLYAFGWNDEGQLGSTSNNGTNTANPTPTLVSLPGATGPVSQIAAGTEHSLALTSTGQLYTFGGNDYGQLGITTNSGVKTPNPTPALVSLPGATGPVTQIAAGAYHSLALTSTGQMYAFGYNLYGELGNTTHTEKPNPTPTLVTLPGASGTITEIAAGAYQSLAVTSAGQLYAFGLNEQGQLGNTTNNATEEPNATPTLVALPSGTTIDAVARGPRAFHTLALVADLAVTSGALAAGQVGVPYSANAQAAGGTAPYAWSASGLPAGLSIDASSGQVVGTPVSPGAANVTLTVTDADGVIADSAVIPLTVAPVSATSTPTQPPTLTSASLTNKRFRVAKQTTAISARKAPLGTAFRFTLSAAATLQITITSTAAGLRSGHSCRAPSATLERRHAKRCTRTLTLGTLTRTGEEKGADSIPFSGRIGHRALSPHSDEAVLSASNTGGRSKPITLSFAVVR